MKRAPPEDGGQEPVNGQTLKSEETAAQPAGVTAWSGYAVYRGESEDGANTASDPLDGADSLAETAYTDAAADTGIQYWYRVDAVDGGGVT